MYYLEPMYINQKSFYRKARVSEFLGKVQLVSYETPVCTIDKGVIHLNGLYSATTLRHIREFLYQFMGLYENNPAYASLISSNFAIKELRKLVVPDAFSMAFNYNNCL